MMKVSAFNQLFCADLSYEEGQTLSDRIVQELEHPPVKGEMVRIGSYVFTLKEVTLTAVRKVTVYTES